jgi:hypothetical protein
MPRTREEAEQLYRRALSLLEQSPGLEHPQVATIYHNIGWWERH